MNETKIITKSASATIAFSNDKPNVIYSSPVIQDSTQWAKTRRIQQKEKKEFDVASHSAFKTPPQRVEA